MYVASATAFYAITNAGSVASNKWTFPAGLPSDSSSPAVSLDGTIYFVGGPSNALLALNPDGTQKWSFFTGGGGGTPAIGLDNTIYFHGADHLYSVSSSGGEKWNVAVSGHSSSPVLGPSGTIYVASEIDSILYAFNQDGSQKWSRDLSPGTIVSVCPLAVAAGEIILVAHDQLLAFTADGTNLWSVSAPSYFLEGPPVVAADGTIFTSTVGSHVLYAFTSLGQPTWHALSSSDRSVPAAVAVDSGGSIYYCVSNSIFALDRSGVVKWTVFGGFDPLSQPRATTSPVVAPDGTLYAALGTVVYAISTGTNSPARSSWPMYQQNARHTGKIEKPSLQQPKKRSDANFQFQLYAQIDQTQTVQTSTDLITWTSLTNVAITNVPMDVVDLSASNFPTRFYRTLSQ